MKMFLCFVLICHILSCNNDSMKAEEKLGEIDQREIQVVDTTSTFQYRWDHDPAFVDSMKKEWNQRIKKADEEREREEENWSTEYRETVYKLNIENFVFLENVRQKFTDDFQPYFNLTIDNRTLKTISSIKLFTSDNTKTTSLNIPETIILKIKIPPKSKVDVSVDVKKHPSGNRVSLHSVVTNDGEIYEASEARASH